MDFWNIVGTIAGGLLVLVILVIVHEFGHFVVGRACGIGVDEFAVGFGPKLLSRVAKSGTRYSLRAIPLGGYCAFHGEEEDMPGDPKAFTNASCARRALTVLAGPVFNLIFAVLIAICALAFCGELAPQIVETPEGMPAYQAGLQPGDRITAINGNEVDFYYLEDLRGMLRAGDPNTVQIGVEREGETLMFSVPLQVQEDGTKLAGFNYGPVREQYGFFEATTLSFKWIWLNMKSMVSAIGGLLFRGEGAENVTGFVGIIQIVGTAVYTSLELTLQLGALISINLAIMNLLPFPALDGGRLVFIGIEAIRRKPFPREKEAWINLAGLVVLFGLMILLTYQDISRLIS